VRAKEDPMTTSQRLYPFLYADDVRAYMQFLDKAFGFVERSYHVEPEDSEHVHAEMALGDAVVMIGQATPKFGTAAPRTAGAVVAGVYAYVDDVDAHVQRARDAGATITYEVEDKPWGDRMYGARDPAGYEWYFATRRQS
jgi:PhnB protein